MTDTPLFRIDHWVYPSLEAPQLELHLQDCLAGLPTLAAECIDVVVTSPPYNIGTQYGQYRDRRKKEEYLGWCYDWAAEVKRVLKPDGSFFLNIGGKPTDPYVPFDVLAEMRHLFQLQNVFHWVKAISPGPGLPIRGHTKPINSDRFVADQHEYIFHLTKRGRTPLQRTAPGVGVPYADKSNLRRGTRGKNGDNRDAGNTWFIPYQTIQSRTLDRPHPASFPVALPERCLRIHGVTPETRVLDPFLGLGHTGIATYRLGGQFVGFEIDADYFAAACALIEEAL